MNNPTQRFSIVIVATDETHSLLQTVRTIQEDCDAKDLAEFIIIHSQNASAACIETGRRLCADNPGKVRLVMQSAKGLGQAAREGCSLVQSSHIVTVASDMAIDVHSVHAMIEQSKKMPNAVIKTSRWLDRDGFIQYNAVRKKLNFVGQHFIKLLFRSPLTDFTQSTMLLPTDLFRRIRFCETDFSAMLEFILIPIRMGERIVEVPAKCFPRQEGKSKNSYRQTAKYFYTALRLRLSPMRKLVRSGVSCK